VCCGTAVLIFIIIIFLEKKNEIKKKPGLANGALEPRLMYHPGMVVWMAPQ
jgi:hypothetical protein